MISPALSIYAIHTSDQEAADKQAWSLLRTGAPVLHARPPDAATQESLIYMRVFVRSSERLRNARAR